MPKNNGSGKSKYAYVRMSQEMLDDLRNCFGYTEQDIEDQLMEKLQLDKVKVFVVRSKDDFDPGPGPLELNIHVDRKGKVSVKQVGTSSSGEE